MNHTMIHISPVLLRPLLAAGAVALLAAPALAQSYPTIVGRWYSPPEEGGSPQDCDTHWGWTIEPMALGNAMVQCRFTGVARDGWEVTWQGQCSMEGQDIAGSKVVATETRGNLLVEFGDGSYVGPLKRCPAR